jgi:hypothetical protein
MELANCVLHGLCLFGMTLKKHTALNQSHNLLNFSLQWKEHAETVFVGVMGPSELFLDPSSNKGI